MSIFDGLGMGLGFTVGLTFIGLIRQILGANLGITVFIMAPGAFLVLAFLVAGMNVVRDKMEKKGKPLAAPSGCLSGDCASCSQSAMCTGKSTLHRRRKNERIIDDCNRLCHCE